MVAGLEILNLHAQGGMAEVYRARGVGADGRTWHYAVKRILPEFTADEDLRKMFVEEARIASLLVHPNIVRVYNLARSENDDYWIVMEFLEGRDLAEAIDHAVDLGQTLPVWMSIHIARQVLSALVYATTQATGPGGRPLGLIHRDISPHNIFLCIDGQVKLTDFGVAKVAESSVHTRAGVTKGKFGYMSPEQLTGEGLDFRSDLYNVGILLYESMTCRRLFHGENLSQFVQAMVRSEVPPLDPTLRVPPELDALLRRALSKDRQARPASALAFDEELRAIAEKYGLVASHEHVAAEIRGLFGSEIESCPVPRQPAPQHLASVLDAPPLQEQDEPHDAQVAQVARVAKASVVAPSASPAPVGASPVAAHAAAAPASPVPGASSPAPRAASAHPNAVSPPGASADAFPIEPTSLVPPNVRSSLADPLAPQRARLSSADFDDDRQTEARAMVLPKGREPATPPRPTSAGHAGLSVRAQGRAVVSPSPSEGSASAAPADPLLSTEDPLTIPPAAETPGVEHDASRRPTVVVAGGAAKTLSDGEHSDRGELVGRLAIQALVPRGQVHTKGGRVVKLSDAKKP